MTSIQQKSHIEWSKHPELLQEIGTLREKNISYPEIARIIGRKHNIMVHGDTIRSAFKRHREFIKRKLEEEKRNSMKKNKARVSVTLEFLEDQLKLPKGVSIDHVEFNAGRGLIDLYLTDMSGEVLPEKQEGLSMLSVSLSDITK